MSGPFQPFTSIGGGGGGGGLTAKSGVATVGEFSGTPKVASVVFAGAFGTAYAVTFGVLTDGTSSFNPTSESKALGGFDINLNTDDTTGLLEVEWHAIEIGET